MTARWAAGALLAALALPMPLTAAPKRPVVVELFTSEACSSCPPAEALLRQLNDADHGILALSFHVTYWDGPVWSDRYALPAATARQNWYAGLRHTELFTPEAVVDGGGALVGSDRTAVTAAIAAAGPSAADAVPVAVQTGRVINVTVGAGGSAPATVWLIGYDPSHVTPVGGGENSGATLTEVNVVRSITKLGVLGSAAAAFTTPPPAGARLAVLVQRDDGRIVGAAAD